MQKDWDSQNKYILIYIFIGSAWNFEDDTDSTTSSETMTSVSDDVPIGSSQLYYTTPPKTVSVHIPKHSQVVYINSPGYFILRL